ncbi:MAG: O-antigen ligase family protein [Verrucomicrobia subdivision 3 bacterium]|nr:O-antigen ligase family protein [Limisphaerales bacterium]
MRMDESGGPSSNSVAAPASAERPRGRTRHPTLLAVRIYQQCEFLSEGLIYGAVIFSPWAFGTTQPWAIWTMNGAGYLLGALLLVKWWIRVRFCYSPPRWGVKSPELRVEREGKSEGRMTKPERSPKGQNPKSAGGPFPIRPFGFGVCFGFRPSGFGFSLGILTGLLLVFCLISAQNARSTYEPDQFGFRYHDYISWLPHSLDSRSSWAAFWNYLALGCAFWALRDWLGGKTFAEQRGERRERESLNGQSLNRDSVHLLPGRLRRLLWVMCINGALLAVEGIAQRLSGSNRLLWVMPTRTNAAAELQFGPYAYRANAAQYFNLLWPVCLGFWWTIWRKEIRSPNDEGQKKSEIRMRKPERLVRRDSSFIHPSSFVLLCVALIAVCPLISNSRGGVIIGLGQLIMATLLFLFGLGSQHGLTKLALCFVVGAVLVTGGVLGWPKLSQRLQESGINVGDRERTYAVARPMAGDYPVFGTGPGTFNVLFQLYRPSIDEYWPAQLHNDWLETRITFGWAGSAMIALALSIVLARWFCPCGIQANWRFTGLVWLAIAGALAHARFDFPFQIYSILFLGLVLCAILSNLSRQS